MKRKTYWISAVALLVLITVAAGIRLFSLSHRGSASVATTERTWSRDEFAGLAAVVSRPAGSPSQARSVLVFLHGLGSHERDLAALGPVLAPESVVVSLRGPLVVGEDAFAWFSLQFVAGEPIHDWPQARESLSRLEQALAEVARRFQNPPQRLFALGFSQGAIMTLGLALASETSLGGYLAFSGRTLPEWAASARSVQPPLPLDKRPIFLVHGTEDTTLPIKHGRASREILTALHASFTYREYPMGHEINRAVIDDTKAWLAARP